MNEKRVCTKKLLRAFWVGIVFICFIELKTINAFAYSDYNEIIEADINTIYTYTTGSMKSFDIDVDYGQYVNAKVEVISLESNFDDILYEDNPGVTLSWGTDECYEKTYYQVGTYYMKQEYDDFSDIGFYSFTVIPEYGSRCTYRISFEVHDAFEKMYILKNTTKNMNMTAGDEKCEYTMEVETDPLEYDGEIRWSSDKKKVVKIDAEGCAMPKKLGEATIKARLENGKSVTTKVMVNKLHLVVGKGLTIDLNDYLSGITGYKRAKITSRNKSIASVKKYKISTKKTGKATLDVKVKNKKYTIIVHVIDQDKMLETMKKSLENALYFPESLSISKIKWNKTKSKCTIYYRALTLGRYYKNATYCKSYIISKGKLRYVSSK